VREKGLGTGVQAQRPCSSAHRWPQCEDMASNLGRHRRAAMIVAATLGALITIGVTVLTVIGVANQPGDRVRSSPPTQTVTSAEPSPPQTPLAAAVQDWKSRAGDHFHESAQALQQVSDAAEGSDAAAVRAGCRHLHDSNVVGLQADLPTPDPALTAELQRMVDDINTATHACMRFTDSMRPEDSSIYQDYLARAMDHLHRAKAILDEDLGRG